MKIIPLIDNENCSATICCGLYLENALNQFGYDCESEYIGNIEKIKNSIIILYKHILSKDKINILRNNNCKIVMDVVDEFFRPNTDVTDLYDYSLLDGIISRVNKVLQDYSFPSHLKTAYIPHHWDIRLQDVVKLNSNNYRPVIISNDFTDVLHVKELHSELLLDIFSQIHPKQYMSYVDKFLVYNIHYNIRKTDGKAYKFKPATKLVTAAALNCPIITNYDWAIRDLIPYDYPFLIENTDLNNVREFIKNINVIVNSPQWQYALDIMETVKYNTALVNLIPKYVEFFEKLN